jgi:hypothetical protein
MLTVVVLLIFVAALTAIWISVSRAESKVRPILLHRDEQSLHHHRNCPGPGAD